MVPDTEIVDIFEPIFLNNHVTVDWILEQTEEGIQELLRPLGRQTNSSKYVMASMTELKRRGGVSPRNYQALTQFPGVAPKVALGTCQEVYGNAQGVPHDIHMFTALGWVPPTDESFLVSFLSKKEAYNYEMCRASMEGWFPGDLWAGMKNQTWAELGQLLNNKHKQSMVAYIDNKVSNFDSPQRVVDKENVP
jgi:endonuclease III